MWLYNPVFLGCSAILVIAVFSPVAECYKPLHICLYPHQHEAICDLQRNNQNFERDGLQNTPIITSFKTKDKKYDYGPFRVMYEPYIDRASAVSMPSVRSGPDVDSRVIINPPNSYKTIAHGEDKALRLVPVVQKVTKDVVEYRTRHIPVVRQRLRTVEEKYTEHVPITETITRPIVDTIVKQVPVLEAKKGRIPQRMKAISPDRAVKELLKFKQSPLYQQGNWGWSYLYPQQLSAAYAYMFPKMSKKAFNSSSQAL